MHADDIRINEVSERIIGCAFRVLDMPGTGSTDKVYENALAHEMREAEHSVAQQKGITVYCKGIVVGEYVADLVVEQIVVVEPKARLQLCLLLNFGRRVSKSIVEFARNTCLVCSDSVIMYTLHPSAGYQRAGGGMVSVVQQWSGDDWQDFALSLLQTRHGPMGVHKIPSSHQGDLGIDFYCTSEAVIYQCYAVEEPIDISTRADRQKVKITTDLKKMVDGADEVAKLFLGDLVKNWVLLVPLHDSKDVNFHCAKKTADLRAGHYPHLDASIEVCIQDQKSFPGAALDAAMASLTILSLSVGSASKEELDTWQASSADLLANATKKLAKRVEPAQVQGAVAGGVEYFLKSNALIDALRSSAPDLHEKVAAAISGKTRRLTFAGPQGGPTPNNIMNAELDSLIQAIKIAAPTLSELNAEDIALGTVADWIMRCPLDFP